MIAILAAMEEELAAFRDRMQNVRRLEQRGLELFTGSCNNVPLSLIKTGVGKVNAAYAATSSLYEASARIVIAIGSAGAIDPSLEIGDVVIGSATAQHDVDLTGFGYKRGQLPDRQQLRPSSPELVAAAQRLAQTSLRAGAKALSGLIVSGDSFMNSALKREDLLRDFPGTLATDMESAAVSQVCSRAGVQFLVVRGISDKANDESADDFSANLKVAADASAALVESLLRELGA